MILNVSGRTDIVAFYSEWFMNRYQEGYVDVRNPFQPHLVSRIYFEDVDAILFCTKNPIPILDEIHKIKKPLLFHVTLTPYRKEIEPFVPPKKKIIEAIHKLSKIIGSENLVVRYDPVFISEQYSIAYHKKAFEKLCCLLEGATQKIIVSFLDEYKNVKQNRKVLAYRMVCEEDYKEIGLAFSQSAKKHGMSVQTCFENRNLSEYGFTVGDCLSSTLAYQMTGKKFKRWTARKEQKCHCVQMVDIGVYNTCPHLCKYCYANYDEGKVSFQRQAHDKMSSLLIGHLEEEDCIRIRKK